MSVLTPNLFDRRFQDFMEVGRARLRSLAPDWTDHNAHDPGITLMELLAWDAEAQLYALSRMRRDERAAYAALLGLDQAGTRAATGLIWSDCLDPMSPVKTFAHTMVLPEDTVVNVVGAESPTFRPLEKLLWVPGKIDRLETCLANGRRIDHTTINAHGDVPFLPFGERAGPRDVLIMTFMCRDRAGLSGVVDREEAKGARWAIGIQAAPSPGQSVGSVTQFQSVFRWPIEAVLVDGQRRMPVKIASDTSQGLLATGALLLDLDAIPSSLQTVTVEFRAPKGFPRPPRILQVEPSVLPVRQGYTISREPHEAKGEPDWGFTLDSPGLRFERGEPPVTLTVVEPTGETLWRRARLSEQGPQDQVYEFDTVSGRVTFGNGVNGRIPPRGSSVLVTYSVSDGQMGDVARNRKWQVGGIQGVFGINRHPMTGGAQAPGRIEERREARKRLMEAHALISEHDIVGAAKALPLLEVGRAWVAVPPDATPRTGVITLVAMRSRTLPDESDTIPETPRWLEAIRRQLTGRMPLGTRLVVTSPRYVEFSIRADIEVHSGRNPDAVKREVDTVLRKRLALVETAGDGTIREPGVPVTRRDVMAWIRSTDGVKKVGELRLRRSDGQVVEKLDILRHGLPRWNAANSQINVQRTAGGAR